MTFTHLAEPIPITEQNWPEGTIPLVTTRTMTFMHENYIRECIEGILMQKTTFPVQVLIHDDASTDRTAEIVREYEQKYPGVITAFYQTENSYSKPDKHERRKDFFDLIQGKYIALCEGDDYWTDPLKLQKQVEFLEANPDYGLVHTGRSVLNNETGKIYPRPLSAPNGVEFPTFTELLMQNRIATLTVMLRSSLIAKVRDDLDSWLEPQLRRDYSTWLGVARYAKIGYIAEYTAVYRRQIGSVSNSSDHLSNLEFLKQSLMIRINFIDRSGMGRDKAHNIMNMAIRRNLPIMLLYRSEFAFLESYIESLHTSNPMDLIFRRLYLSNLSDKAVHFSGRLFFYLYSFANHFRGRKRGVYVRPF